MRWKTIAACLVLACTAVSAAAQVTRCQDAAGKTIYTDGPCLPGQSGVLVERQKSSEEILQERLQAAEANERKYRQQAAELEAQSRIITTTPAQEQSVQQDKSASYACRQKQRDHETISSSQTGTEEERRNRINASILQVNAACGLQAEQIQPPPTFVVPNRNARPTGIVNHCDRGFCNDSRGGVDPRNRPNLYIGPGGKTCHRAGAAWNCS